MSDSEQKGFVVYGDTKAVVDELSDEQAGRLFRGMLEYFVDGDDPDFDDVLKLVFIPIRQQMDRNADKYNKMCDRNRENAKKRWDAVGCGRIRSDAVDANINTNTNTDTNKDTGTNTESPEQSDDISLSLVSYLNSKTGSSYSDTEQVRELIESKLDDGYSIEDLKSVIDKKSVEWSCDGKMRSYLRPSTLFGDKFEEYLNSPEPVEVQEQRKSLEQFQHLQEEREKKSGELKKITNRILKIGGVNMTDNYEEYEDLKLQAAVLEQEIDNLDARLQREAVS